MLLVILGIGAGLVVWKNKVGDNHNAKFNSMTKEEVEMLFADIGKANPMALKRLAEDPELKKEQLKNLKQLLAFASEAERTGLSADPLNKQELKNIKSEVIAVNYDREINQDKGPMPPFGFIDAERVKAFYGQADQPKGAFDKFKDAIGLGATDQEGAFNKFLETKLALLQKNNPNAPPREVTPEEREQARDFFAKVGIYDEEYATKSKAGELNPDFVKKVNLQVKLQQAQFLARLYSEKAAEESKVTDEEVDKYISEHPELSPEEKKKKAQEVLDKAKGGEDFAKLANEFSEDPGNKDAKGEPQGGIYKDVPKGRMVAPFEAAALALEPGQISPELVETDFGYHVIKLEKKGETKGPDGNPQETYDVRHILISTAMKDPDNPMSREMPVKQFVRQKLEEEKQDKIIEEAVARNHITLPDDFDVPEPSEEDIKKVMEQQMGPMPQNGPPPPPPAPSEDKPAANSAANSGKPAEAPQKK